MAQPKTLSSIPVSTPCICPRCRGFLIAYVHRFELRCLKCKTIWNLALGVTNANSE